jgi:hypothetical protein
MNFFSLKNRIAQKNGLQDGVTLLLAVLITSGIFIITLTIAVFVTQEIRASRASVLTEPAIIAAETAGESGIYRIKRGGVSSVTNCSASTPYTQVGGATGGTTNTRVRSCLDFVPATFELKETDSPLEFYLYDPTDVNGNFCMEASACAGDQLYQTVVIRHLTGTSNVYVNAITLDGATVGTQLVSPGTTYSMNIPRDIAGSTDERVKFTMVSTLGTATVQVSTTGTYTGLPDYRTIDAQGCVANVNITNCDGSQETYKRRLNITVPATE